MEASRKPFFIFAGIVSALIIVTTVLVLLNTGNGSTLLPEDSPEGIVQRYLIALQDNDYRTAYEYLSFDDTMRFENYEEWARMVSGYPRGSSLPPWKASLGNVTLNGNFATVDVTIETFRPGGPFSDPVRSNQVNFQLTKIENNWLITSPTYVYWIY